MRERGRTLRRLAVACLLAGLLGARRPPAATITEYPAAAGDPAAHKPFWITKGPDGTVWFSDAGSAGGVRQFSLQGEPLETIPSAGPVDLVFGANGVLYWTEQGFVSYRT